MGPLAIYDVVMPNGVHTQMQLTEVDAKRYGATPVVRKPKLPPQAQHKMRTANSGDATPERVAAKPKTTRKSPDKATD